MVGVGEHVDWLNGLDTVFLVEQRDVASLCGRVATHIDYAPWLGVKDNTHHILVHAGTWRVNYHHIGDAMLCHKFACEHVFHVAGIELGVLDAVNARVKFSVLNGLGDIFNTNYLARLASHKVGNRAGAGVEVID